MFKKVCAILIVMALLSTCFISVASNGDYAYVDHTANAIAELRQLSRDLHAFNDQMEASKTVTKEEKNVWDEKINAFRNRLKTDEYIVYEVSSSGYVIYGSQKTVAIDPKIWDNGETLSDAMPELSKEVDKYQRSVVLYINKYKSLAEALAPFAKKEDGIYDMDGLKVTCKAGKIEVDLSLSDYAVEYDPDTDYGYKTIKVTAPSGTTYGFVMQNEGDYRTGYFVPTEKGAKLCYEFDGRKEVLLDTSKLSYPIIGEPVSLSDIFFNLYLPYAASTHDITSIWTYKGIIFRKTATKRGIEYLINLPNPSNGMISNQGSVHEKYIITGDVTESTDSSDWICINIESGSEYYWATNAGTLKYQRSNYHPSGYWYIEYSTTSVHIGADNIGPQETPSDWAKETVEEAIELGLVPRQFQIQYTSNMTRKEFCRLAMQMYSAKTEKAVDTSIKTPFNDVDDVFVTNAAALRVVQGVGSGRFIPDRNITRQEAAIVLRNLARALDIDTSQQREEKYVDDEDIAYWAKEEVYAISNIKGGDKYIMEGTGNGRFSPLSYYTREQGIATMLRLYSVE